MNTVINEITGYIQARFNLPVISIHMLMPHGGGLKMSILYPPL